MHRRQCMKCALLISSSLMLAALATAADRKIARDLDRSNSDSTVDVIVQFRHTPTDAHHAKVLNRGGQLRSTLDLVKGGAYSVPASALKNLSEDPEVTYISADHAVHGTLDYAMPAVGANLAHAAGWDGSGIAVAVLDSGVSNHPDLTVAKGPKSRIVYNRSFVGPGHDDHYGHGTHVAGIIGGNGKSSTGFAYTHTFDGIAPNVNIVNLRVLDDKGDGRDSSVIAAIQAAIQLKNTYNIRVMNLSLGRPVFESFTQDPLCQAVEAAWKAGITVVVAAGNDGRNDSFGNEGYGTISSPGNDPYVITVGAMKTNGTLTRSDDTIASYSAKGPTAVDHIIKPDIVAPGNRIISLLAGGAQLPHLYPSTLVPVSYYGPNVNGQSNVYFRLSGTSLATPMVSGAAALLLQKEPTLTPDEIKARLMKTASKSFPTSSVVTDSTTGKTYTDYYDIFTIGAGYLDIAAALNSTEDAPPGRALSPLAVVDPSTNLVYAIANPALVCGSTAVWGSSLLQTVCGNNVVWGSTAVWGSNVVWGSTAVWGTTAVWGSGVFQGSGSTELPPMGMAPIWSGPEAWTPGSPQVAAIVWGTTSPWIAPSSIDVTSSILPLGEK